LLAAIDVAGASTAPRLYAATSLRSVRGIFGRHDESVAVTPIIDALEAEVEEDTNWVNLGHLNISALLPHWRGENAACLDLVDLGKLVHPDLLALQGVSWVLSLAQGEIGRYDDALATLDTVIAQSTVAGEVFFCSRAINTVGWIRGDLGDRAGCVEWNERCLAFLRAVDMPDQEVESNARLNLAESYLSMGDLPSAARELERVEHIVRGKPIRGTWMLWRYSQRLHLLTARLQLGSGQVSAIGTRIDDCVALAESSGSPKYLGKAAHLRGRILLAENELDGAVDQGELALKTAAQMRHPPDVWRAHELLADIARGRDDRDAERFHLGEADDTLAAVEADLRDAACLAGVRRLRLGLVRS
jgi:tetratricopeptide (TPR) repeat protein